MKKEKRKAIDGKLISPSKTSPGYFKYQFTIRESDGTTNIIPAYGKDMSDALERLVWSERLDKVNNNKTFNIFLLCAWLTSIIIPSIITSIKNEPFWIVISMCFSIILGILTVRLHKYFNKK